MILVNQIVSFVNHQYLWKEPINVFDFLHRYSSQGRVASKTNVVDWVRLGLSSNVQTFQNFTRGEFSHVTFTCSKSAIKTPEKCVKHIQGQQKRHYNYVSVSCCL